MAPAASPAVPPDGLPKRERTKVLAIMMSGTTAACISQSMMIAALPTIMHEFNVDAALGQLLTTAYIFTLGLFSAMTAYLVNRLDTRKLFLASMGSFVVGCAASLVAPNYPLLLASRLLQAGGAGIALPLIQVVALSVYPKSEYGKAMGIVGVIIGFAPAIGPTISGFFIDVWGWRSVFVALGGVTLVVMVLAALFLKDVVKHESAQARFDVASGLLYTAGFALVLVGVSVMESAGQVSVAAVLPALVGAAGLAVFAVRQLRIPNPLLKLSCFRDRTFSVGLLLVLLGHIGFMSASIMVPLFVQDVQGQSAAVSGLTILPGAVLLGFLNPVTGRYLDKHGPKPLIIAGTLLLVAGTLAFVPLGPGTPEWVVTVLYGVRTVGVACLMMPMTAYACTTLAQDDIAQGTAIITSLRQIFGSLASSLLIALMALASSSPLGIDAFGFGVSFAVQAAIIAVGGTVGFILVAKGEKGK